MEQTRSVAEEVIQAFGGITKAAKALGHKHVTTVDGWRRAGRIPSWRRAEILAAAKKANVPLPEDFVKDNAA